MEAAAYAADARMLLMWLKGNCPVMDLSDAEKRQQRIQQTGARYMPEW